MADISKHRQQVALWTRVNLLHGGLVTTDSHKCPSEKLLELLEFIEYLNVLVSSGEIGVISLSIFPSPFSKANQLLLRNVHFFPVWRSLIIAWLKYQDGCFPELSCLTWIYWTSPNDIGKWMMNPSSFPRASTVLPVLIMFLLSIMGWLSASLPWMTMATLASVPEFLHTPVTTVSSYSKLASWDKGICKAGPV